MIIRDVEITAPVNAPNTDGVDPDSCEDVLIEGLTYSGGDDAIAIKSGWDCYGIKYGAPTRGVVIRHLTIKATHAAAVAIGSEMSGGVENVTIVNATINNARTAINLK